MNNSGSALENHILMSIKAFSELLEKLHFCKTGNAPKVNQHLLQKYPAALNFLCCESSLVYEDLQIINSLNDAYSYFKNKCGHCEDVIYEEVLQINESMKCFSIDQNEKESSELDNAIFLPSEEDSTLMPNESTSIEDPLSLYSQAIHDESSKETTSFISIDPNASSQVTTKILTLSTKEIENVSEDKKDKKKYPNILICEFCGKVFSGRERAYRFFYHRNKLHTQEIAYKCLECSKVYWGERELYNHIQIHNNAGHICHVCGIKCNRKPDLLRHLAIHKDKKLSCKFCHKKFRRKDNLNVHERSHTGDMPYICSLCGSGYPQKNQLKLHGKRCPIPRLQQANS